MWRMLGNCNHSNYVVEGMWKMLGNYNYICNEPECGECWVIVIIVIMLRVCGEYYNYL